MKMLKRLFTNMSLNKDLKELHEVLYYNRYRLRSFKKVKSVIFDTSLEHDLYFIFDSMYGQAEVILYTENEQPILKYCGKVEFEFNLTQWLTYDNMVSNRIRELKTYFHSLYGIPRRRRWQRYEK